MTKDPLEKVEKMVRSAHDEVGRRTQPILTRYPLLFSFLLVFSVAAFLHGFELWADHIPFFEKYPSSLMIIGIIALFITGKLYQSLEKM